jgi:putative flavoprotein involved in K+ transport
LIWFAASQILKVTTRPGRKVRDHFLHPPRGIPLGRVRRTDLTAAGIQLVPRTVGVRDGRPVLEDGRVADVTNVVWCTGYRPDFSWIDFPVFDAYGYPEHHRGIVASAPGLYFMGLPFQYALSSVLVGGVGRDAAHIVERVERKRAAARTG